MFRLWLQFLLNFLSFSLSLSRSLSLFFLFPFLHVIVASLVVVLCRFLFDRKGGWYNKPHLMNWLFLLSNWRFDNLNYFYSYFLESWFATLGWLTFADMQMEKLIKDIVSEVFRTLSNIYDGAFLQKWLTLFGKKFHRKCLLRS